MDRPNRYDSDGLPLSFGANRQGNTLRKPSASQNDASINRPSSVSPQQSSYTRSYEESAGDFRSSTNSTNHSPTSSPARSTPNPQPHQAASTTNVSPPIPIPIRRPLNPTRVPSTFSMRVGHPPPKDRNPRNLTVSTTRHDPFVHTSTTTPAMGSRSGSAVTTPARSLETPDQNMIFDMEMSAGEDEFPGAEDMRSRGESDEEERKGRGKK